MRAIVFCTTCRFPDGSKLGPDGLTAGETLARHAEAAVAERGGRHDFAVARQACLWNCSRPCSVVFRDERRFSYVTGGHGPYRSQAEAIIAWFDLHGTSETGEVPFRQWPAEMRGHFIARIPPVRR
jgi:predicted metal-binding protein